MRCECRIRINVCIIFARQTTSIFRLIFAKPILCNGIFTVILVKPWDLLTNNVPIWRPWNAQNYPVLSRDASPFSFWRNRLTIHRIHLTFHYSLTRVARFLSIIPHGIVPWLASDIIQNVLRHDIRTSHQGSDEQQSRRNRTNDKSIFHIPRLYHMPVLSLSDSKSPVERGFCVFWMRRAAYSCKLSLGYVTDPSMVTGLKSEIPFTSGPNL